MLKSSPTLKSKILFRLVLLANCSRLYIKCVGAKHNGHSLHCCQPYRRHWYNGIIVLSINGRRWRRLPADNGEAAQSDVLVLSLHYVDTFHFTRQNVTCRRRRCFLDEILWQYVSSVVQWIRLPALHVTPRDVFQPIRISTDWRRPSERICRAIIHAHKTWAAILDIKTINLRMLLICLTTIIHLVICLLNFIFLFSPWRSMKPLAVAPVMDY